MEPEQSDTVIPVKIQWKNITGIGKYKFKDPETEANL